MKSFLWTLIFTIIIQTGTAQLKYGITGGLNMSSGILPELDLNTDINAILNGDDVIVGQPQLADFVALYKVGVFLRLDSRIVSLKFGVNYDKTNIKKEVDASVFTVNTLNIDLTYLDFDFIASLNLLRKFYISAGYVPAILIQQEGSLNVKDFDQRLLIGFGFKIFNGATLDLNAIIGLNEIIEGSYIHNLMIPVTLSIPLN